MDIHINLDNDFERQLEKLKNKAEQMKRTIY